MKDAALFALGFLSVSFWLHDSARCQTSLAPPLSLAPPPPLTDKGSAPPAATTSVWPPTATAKGSAPSATTSVGPPSATEGVPPPATAKRSVPPAIAKDTPRPAIPTEALPTATAKDMPPTAPDHASSSPVIGRLPPSPKPAADYDGFSADIVDDGDASGQTTRPAKPRRAKSSKLGQESDSIAGQQSVDQAEDEKLKRKLTICRDCK
jgi:hypothetical protein